MTCTPVFALLLILDKKCFVREFKSTESVTCQKVDIKMDANLVLGGTEPHQTKYFIVQEIPPSTKSVKPAPRLLS